jgi:dihydroxyacid dehydratase/phosphogluconate dehydratase
VSPEGLAGGPLGKILEGDVIRIHLDLKRIDGRVDLVGDEQERFAPEAGAEILARRGTRKDLAPNPALPDDTRLWASLQLASGGAWRGCVYDVEKIAAALEAGRKG